MAHKPWETRPPFVVISPERIDDIYFRSCWFCRNTLTTLISVRTERVEV
ncbi:MAG: hypothetical protein LBD67_05260 [Candidatus Accumulibacter sp.]|nr:hypothetical protein [Accumulibacter sp.]